MTYQEKKERAREKAIQWQGDFGYNNYSYSDLAAFGHHFENLGKRYGLIREFKENGII